MKNYSTETLNGSLQLILKLGQLLGFFPTFHAYFEWKSWKILYAVSIITITTIFNLLPILWGFIHYQKFSFIKIELIIKSSTAIINSFLLFRLSKNWPIIRNEWNQVNKVMKKYNNYPKHLKKLISTISIIFLFFSLSVYKNILYVITKNIFSAVYYEANLDLVK